MHKIQLATIQFRSLASGGGNLGQFRLEKIIYFQRVTDFLHPFRSLSLFFGRTFRWEAQRTTISQTRELYSLLLRDAHPVSLQGDVINMLAGCEYISVIHPTSFFFQWRAHPNHRYMQTVPIHCGQETFNVYIMEHINSTAYLQRQTNNIFRLSSKQRTEAYVPDWHERL